MRPFLAASSASSELHSAEMESESAEAARRSRRIRSSDAWPHLARLPARQSHPRLPGHNALPARKWYMLWAAGLRRLVRKADLLNPCRSLRIFVSHTISRSEEHTSELQSLMRI